MITVRSYTSYLNSLRSFSPANVWTILAATFPQHFTLSRYGIIGDSGDCEMFDVLDIVFLFTFGTLCALLVMPLVVSV